MNNLPGLETNMKKEKCAMKDFRFACTACGACCNTPPSLRLGEVLQQSENFLLAGSFVLMAVKSPSSKEIRHLIKTVHDIDPALDPEGFSASAKAYCAEVNAFTAPIGKTGLGVIATMDSIDVWRGEKCPMLAEDGACGIYETRPTVCRSAPIDQYLAGRYRIDALEDFVTRGTAKMGFKCDTSSSAPILLDDRGRIQDAEMKKAWLAGRQGKDGDDNRGIKSATHHVYKALRGVLNFNDKKMIEIITQHSNAYPGFSYPGFYTVVSGFMSGYWTSDEIVEISTNQIDLISEIIDEIPPDAPSPYTFSSSPYLLEAIAFERLQYEQLRHTAVLSEDPPEQRQNQPA